MINLLKQRHLSSGYLGFFKKEKGRSLNYEDRTAK